MVTAVKDRGSDLDPELTRGNESSDHTPLHPKGPKKKAKLSKFEQIQDSEPKKKGMLKQCNSKQSLYASASGLPPLGLVKYASSSKEASQVSNTSSASKDTKIMAPASDRLLASSSKTPRAGPVGESASQPKNAQIITQYTDKATNQTNYVKFENGKYVLMTDKDVEDYEGQRRQETTAKKVLVRVKDKNLLVSGKVRSPFVNQQKPAVVNHSRTRTGLGNIVAGDSDEPDMDLSDDEGRRKNTGLAAKDIDAKSRSSTPDHQKLIENEKMRTTIKAEVAQETHDYSEYSRNMMKTSISDINKVQRQSYKEEGRLQGKKDFQEFTKQFFTKDSKAEAERIKNEMKYQENALKFREQTNKARLAALLGRETCDQQDSSEKRQIDKLRKEKKEQIKRKTEKENYHDEAFMDKLIQKIKQREKQENKEDEDQMAPQRKCVDFRYLNDQISKETKQELQTAKNQAAANFNRKSTVVGIKQPIGQDQK